MGLTAPGQGHIAVREGWTEKTGKLPVNPSGGLKSKGHPIGATGVSMHIMASMQLMGEAGGMQIPACHAGWRLQYGRRGSRELLLDPGARALTKSKVRRARQRRYPADATLMVV